MLQLFLQTQIIWVCFFAKMSYGLIINSTD